MPIRDPDPSKPTGMLIFLIVVAIFLGFMISYWLW